MGRAAELEEIGRLLASRGAPFGAALFGEPGVGKTRLLTDAVTTQRERGVTVEWVRATDAAREIPLGSFAHLVDIADGGPASGQADLLHAALARLRQRAGDGPFVLAVDDGHLLDEVSVALLHLAVTQSAMRVVMTVRRGGDLPEGLVGLWKDDLVRRIDVGPLSRADTEELVLSVLGRGVTASLLDRVWRLSRGNALFVRELVTTALERRSAGAGGPVSSSESGEGMQPRLRDLVDERLRLLPPARRAALEVMAVGEQVPLVAAERLIGADALDELDARGLIEVVDSAGVEVVQLVHPLHGEVLVAGLSRLRRRAVLHDLVGAVADLERFDRLRLATWQLESGRPGEPDLLVALAHEALGRLDHPLAERLARAASASAATEAAEATGRGVASGVGIEAGLVLAESLAGRGTAGEAGRVLDGLRPEVPADVARVAIARASNLFLHLDRSADAFAVLADAEARLAGEPAWQADCRSVAAQMSMFAFRYDDAERQASDVLADPAAPDTARVRATPVVVTVWAAAGRISAALDLLDDDLVAAARRHRRVVPYGEVQLAMARFQALWWGGDAHRLDAYTAGGLGLHIDHPPPSLQGIVAGFRGGALIARGHAAAALAELDRSVRALDEVDWFAQRPLAEAMRARAAVFAGELATADEAIAAADAAFARDPQRSARTLPYIELSRAWILAARGQRSEAAGRCLALGTAMEHAAKPVAVEALHAAVRLGHAAEACEALDRLAAVVDGPFAPVAARHAAAVTGGNADALAAVATELEDLGSDLVAAEAWRAAGNLRQRAGSGALAAEAHRRADTLLASAGRPRSPALAPVESLGEPLTKREREVAELAARGATSPEIAATLHLSVRTVDTHLARVYRKLLVSGRHELAAALEIDRDDDA